MSDAPDQQPPDPSLAEIVDAAEKQAESFESNAQESIREAQHIRDVAKVAKDFLKAADGSIPPPIIEEEKAAWRYTVDRLDEGNRILRSVMPLIAMTSTNSMLSTSGMMMGASYVYLIPPERQLAAEAARQGLHRIVKRQNLFESVEKEIRRLGLNLKVAKRRDPLELLRQTQTHLEVPSSNTPSPESVLIPLREAIEQSVSILLQRRPNQEGARADQEKVVSICSQMGSQNLQIKDIKQLAAQFSNVTRNLSASKQARMTRQQIQDRVDEGLLFFQGLLEFLDSNKMRPIA